MGPLPWTALTWFATCDNLPAEVKNMPTKHPRLHVVLEPPLFKRLKGMAKKNGLSMSLEAREIIRNVFRFSGTRGRRIYKGKNIRDLIGAYRLGKGDPTDVLVKQVHG